MRRQLALASNESGVFKARFYGYNTTIDGSPGVEIVFNVLEGRFALFRTSVNLRGTSIEKLLSNSVANQFDVDVLTDSYIYDRRRIRFDFRLEGPIKCSSSIKRVIEVKPFNLGVTNIKSDRAMTSFQGASSY